MTLPNPRSLADEIALSLQHIRRISTGLPNVHDGNWRGVYQGLVAWVVHELDIPATKKGLVLSEVRTDFILYAGANYPTAVPRSSDLDRGPCRVAQRRTSRDASLLTYPPREVNLEYRRRRCVSQTRSRQSACVRQRIGWLYRSDRRFSRHPRCHSIYRHQGTRFVFYAHFHALLTVHDRMDTFSLVRAKRYTH